MRRNKNRLLSLLSICVPSPFKSTCQMLICYHIKFVPRQNFSPLPFIPTVKLVCLSHCSTSSPCVFPHTELMFFKDAFKALCQAMTERGLYPSYKALFITSGTEYTSRCATALHVEAIPLGTTLLAGKHCSPDALQLLQAAKRHLSHQKDAQGRGKGPKQTQTSFFPIQYMSILYFLDRSSLSYLLKRKTKPNKTQIRK